MKKIIILLLAIVAGMALYSCKSKAVSYQYEMVCMGVGSQGSNLLKVYSYARSVDKATIQAKHDAVHGVLFKGIVGGNGCSNQPPIVKPNEYQSNKEFFDNFFKGEHLRFVNISSDGTINPKDRLKVGRQYKIGVTVSVNKNELRKYLETQGVIKKLGHMF